MIDVLLLFFGCEASTGTPLEQPCSETRVDVGEAPITEDALWDLVGASSYASIRWDRSITVPTSDLSFEITLGAGEIFGVTRSGSGLGCRPGPELGVPVLVDIAVDDAGVVARIPDTLYGSGAGASDVYFDNVVAPCALSGGWLEAATSAMTDSFGPGTPSWSAQVFGSLGAAGLDLQGEYADQKVGLELWRGAAVPGAEDP